MIDGLKSNINEHRYYRRNRMIQIFMEFCEDNIKTTSIESLRTTFINIVSNIELFFNISFTKNEY